MDEDYNTYIQIYTCRILKIFTIELFDSRGEIILFLVYWESFIFLPLNAIFLGVYRFEQYEHVATDWESERAGWIFPKNSEVICLRRPLARRQQKLIVPAGRRVCGRPQTRAGRGSDAGETQLGRVCGRPQTRAGRVSDAVFDKLFLGGTVLLTWANFFLSFGLNVCW